MTIFLNESEVKPGEETERKVLQVEKATTHEVGELLADKECLRTGRVSLDSRPHHVVSGWYGGCWMKLGGMSHISGVSSAGFQLTLGR